MDNDKAEHFNEWAILELFGRQRIAGRVSEAVIGGCAFVRVDVPGHGARPAFTKLFGQGAIYAITITDEGTARMAAAEFAPEPMDKWTAEHMIAALPEPRGCGLDPMDGDGDEGTEDLDSSCGP